LRMTANVFGGLVMALSTMALVSVMLARSGRHHCGPTGPK
jgi:hypothetical protein